LKEKITVSSSRRVSEIRRQLRAIAEERLRTGTAPPSTDAAVGPEALSVLHRLALLPESADDALRLLHELQVHQVEMDLQLAQVQTNEHELAEELAVYQGLFQNAPAAYVNVGLEGNIIQANRTSAEIFGIEADDLPGQKLATVIPEEGRAAVVEILNQLRNGALRSVCEIALAAGMNSWRRLLVSASLAPGSRTCLLLFVDMTDVCHPASSA
jgi:PAS domain S-box-containing protein